MSNEQRIKNTASLGFEKELWESANILRGNLPSSEYKSVVLGLIFLKYINDSFDKKYQELVAEEMGFEEDADEYIGEGIFFVPEEARWKVIQEKTYDPEIGLVIDNAMRAIERENDRLKNILFKNYARPELDKRRLGDVVSLFSNIKLDGQNEQDVLGRTYEYCLGQFAAQEGQRGGEFFTPSSVVRTLVEVLQPYEGRVYDPACGSGGMFVQSKKFIESHQGDIRKISVWGQELNSTTWKLAQMNLAIRGLEANLGKTYADTFFDDQHPTLKAEFVMANPPFNLKKWGAERLQEDVRWKYGIPPENNANFAWMQHMIHHLGSNGRMGLVLANGSLSSQTGGEGTIRKNIIEDDLVEGIIALPSQLFYTTGIPVCIWFISRNKQQPGKTLFIDARNMGHMETRKLRNLADVEITKMAETFDAFRRGEDINEKGFAASVTTADIAAQDYILTPGRYVGIAETEVDEESFEEKVERITSELSKLFERSHELEDEIRKQLGSIGIEF